MNPLTATLSLLLLASLYVQGRQKISIVIGAIINRLDTYRTFFCIALALLGIGRSDIISGQGLFNQTNLYIPQDIDIHVDGDFQNDGFIQNQGNFSLTGNWTNNDVYQGLGTINLLGSTPQNFFNNKNEVHTLVVNGAGPIRIQDRVSVTKILQLSMGIVTVGDEDTLTVANGALITEASSQSYIDGALTHEGTGYKFYPVGKNGGYHPLELLDQAGIDPAVEVEVFENVPNLDMPASGSLFSNVYWQRKTVEGSFLSSPISLGHSIPDNYTDRHALDVFQADALNAPFTPLGRVSVEYGPDIDKVTSGSTASGSFFVIGQLLTPGGLPGQFYLSTSLSPSASDPDNRLVKIFGNQLDEEDFQFIVYNRWGLTVYESNSLADMISRGWDGNQQSSGVMLPSGAYPYFFRAINKSGDRIEQKGIISIIR
ncbi:MAG: gliding motility-associated C-terminal domain-containing protein [Chryseolinea sp.]